MTIYHWKLSLFKDAQRVTLFATTTGEMIAGDLAGEPGSSLIHTTRQYHRRPQTEMQDHQDLATGAFMTYAAEAPYNLDFEQVEAVEDVPEGAPRKYVGGDRNETLVPIWEETVDLELDLEG